MTMPLRRYRFGVTAALALVLVAALAATAAAAPRRGARASLSGPLGGLNVVGLGYNSSLAEAGRSIAVARGVRARVVRVEIPWAVLEPRPGAGIDAHALAYTDRLMADARAADIKVIMTVERTPCWASSAPAPKHSAVPSGESAQICPPARSGV